MKIDIGTNSVFDAAFNDECAKYGPEMQTLNGFSEADLSPVAFTERFKRKGVVADATIDSSANVSSRDVCSLQSEMYKAQDKLIALSNIFVCMANKYGKGRALKWLEQEFSGGFYLHDASSSDKKPYCFAYDLEDLVNKGLYFIDQFNAQPPQHLVTYTDFVAEFVSWTSNRSSGACGLPSFLIYSYYFWRKDCDNGYYIKSPEYYRDQEFQRIIYKLNQPYIRVNQPSFVNFSIFDREYLASLFGGKYYPDGTPIIMYADELIEYQKRFMDSVSRIRESNMMTYPVLSYSLLFANHKFVDEEFAKWCCAHNMRWNDSNFFTSADVTSLSNCCRLVSDVKNLGYFNSIGGTALEVGSVKVNTINLARIAYESQDIAQYMGILGDRVALCCATLDCVRDIIKHNIEVGLLPNYTKDVISLESQYNTIGIIGLYEAVEYMGRYTEDGPYVQDDALGNRIYTESGIQFAEKILAQITQVKNNFARDKEYSINIEQIPAERAATILMEKDRLLYPDKVPNLPMYGNQWVPLSTPTSITHKVQLSARLDKACSGGSIAHINLDAPLTNFDEAWELLNKIADSGVTYFAFCTRISACKNNHGFYGEICPICSNPKVTTYQRIVGFLVPEINYSKERRKEFNMRRWYNSDQLNHLQGEED